MPPEDDAPSTTPRAFAQGTGLMLQVVGMCMFMSSCCVCSMGWLVDPSASPAQVAKLLDDKPTIVDDSRNPFSTPGKTGVVLMIMFTSVGGLALTAFGLGLQTDKPKAAWAATITSLLLVVIFIVAGVCLWRGGVTPVGMTINAVLIVLSVMITGFCIAALKQIRQHPPSGDIEILPPDWEPPRRHHM